MLVDDDPKFRDLLERILVDDDFDVTASVSSAEAALAAVAEGTEPDVVVVDYTLPDVDGLRLADELCLRRPGQRVIIFSSLFDLALRREVEDRGFLYVEKVDGIDALETAISAASPPH
ncbi:hypothetical protein BH18ACT4_BH18ACT4_01290 [soil metagenome]